MIRTSVLGEAVGIQWSGLTDKSETNSQTGLGYPLIVGQFKRGRTDQPMTVTSGNIKALLGYDPTNKDYIAIQDYLDTKVPSVQVLRIGSIIDSDWETAAYQIASLSQYQELPAGTYHVVLQVFEDNAVKNVTAQYTSNVSMQLTYLLFYLLVNAGLAYIGNDVYPDNDAVSLFALFDTDPFASTGVFGSSPSFNIVEARSVAISILKTSVAGSIDIYDYLFSSGTSSAKVRSDGYMAEFTLP
ncbi:hypothetical protein [Acinetobacter sp. MB5]|uniref:hypothetical protein n=1 Tax=Acinetobacter sp. MB5 TaxID=2069438 RepID=UPI001D0DA15F|nr:hypothetical protein [Acinetobacter sp. MB5]